MMCRFAALTVVWLGTLASADTLRWINGAGGSYGDAANWDAGRVPVAADGVVFDLPGTYTVTLPGGSQSVAAVDVVNGVVTLAGPGTLYIPSGEQARHVRVGDGAADATLILLNSRLETSNAPLAIAAHGTMAVRTGASFYSGGGFYGPAGGGPPAGGGGVGPA